MWPLNSLFMHNVLGRSLTEAGTIMGLQSACSLVGQFMSGFLSDRFGARKMLTLGLCTAILDLTLIGSFPVWQVYAPGIILFGFAVAFVFVPLNALVASIWPEGGRRGFNYLYVANNAGVAVGTAIGGVVALVSFRLVFLLNALTFTIYFLVIGIGVFQQAPRQQAKATQHTVKPRLTQDKGFPSLAALSAGIFFVWTAYNQWVTVLPIVMTQRGFALPSYSFLWTLNGIFIVTLQPVTALIIRRWATTFQSQFYWACVLMASTYLILEAQMPYASYVVAMLILTLGEMLILPSVPAAAAYLASDGNEGAYQGIVGGAASGGRMLGPVLGGLVFDHAGSSMVWLMAFGAMAIGLTSFGLYDLFERRLRATSPSNAPTRRSEPQ